MTGLHPPGKVSSERKENIAFRRFVLLLLTALAGKLAHCGSYPLVGVAPHTVRVAGARGARVWIFCAFRLFQLMSLPTRANVLLAPDIAKQRAAKELANKRTGGGRTGLQNGAD